MADQLKITYGFKLSNNIEKKIEILINKETLALIRENPETPPDWARLDFQQCSNCPLNTTLTPNCPVAVNLAGHVREFKDVTGADRALVTVFVKERAYVKECTMQEGLSPLLGIIMATSGCPMMEPLKPMVRYHLPFASLDETVYRMISMFLMAQFLRARSGKKPEWTLDGLMRIYGEVKNVNRDFGMRMRAAAKCDANIHALVNLNVFAVMVPIEAERTLQDIAPSFSSYLR
jgi:hypothetical protein